MDARTLLTTQMLNRELMMLADAKRGLLVCSFDIKEDEFIYRWLADGRKALFRLKPSDLLRSLDDIDTELRPVIEDWRKAEPGDDSETAYSRLKDRAGVARLDWAEDWMRG